MQKDSKIYIAGHRGLVGSTIMRKLLDQGCQNLVVRTHKELDLTDQSATRAFFDDERPEYVFLAAGRVGGILANDTYPADFIRDNLMIQANVIDAAYRYGAAKLLSLGSSCIYPKMAPQPIKEEYLLSGPLEPTNEWYALAKIAGIKMCQAYRRQYGFNAISVMPTNLYGQGDNFDLETSHVLPALIRKFHLAKLAIRGDSEGIAEDEMRFGPINGDFRSNLNALLAQSPFCCGQSEIGTPSVVLWGTGAPKREFLFVDDLADACVFLMQTYDSGEIINIGVGEDISIKDLAGMVAEAVDFEGAVSFDSAKPDGTPRKLLDVSRINSLGWHWRVDLRQGIRTTYDWYLKTADH
ncbi:MAG: GDP-L-fucose synthase [Syntrophobacteraceae bacterium]